MARGYLHLLLAFMLSSCCCLHGSSSSLESVPDLVKAMYIVVDGYPCVRLLNLSGEIGCANPGHEKVVAPIVKYQSINESLSRPSAILVPSDDIIGFFNRVSSDLPYAQRVAGVLIESGTYYQNGTGFSPVEKFPQAEFAPYKNVTYEWNPIGSNIMQNHYAFPVFLLSRNSTLILREVAAKNENSIKDYPVDVAEFDLIMQTTKSGTHNSESCLKERSCLPLGGYSVWSSLPPINISSSSPAKPIIFAMASVDSASLFRDKSLGADSSLSGLIALLAAVDALSHIDGVNDLRKQLVFMVFTGEAWGYLGSRRFLAELDNVGQSVDGLNITLIEQVLEIGSVGKGMTEGVATFFAHSGENSSATMDTLNALQLAAGSFNTESIQIKNASSSNPGIPPSSLMSFMKKNSSISGVVVEEFDTAFSNKFYHSHPDDASNINSSSIVAAASLVARALYILATEGSKLSTPTLQSISINITLVNDLVGCLLTCEPGLSCELVAKYISPSQICPNHYVGVMISSPEAPPQQYADDTSRFVWNFLADRTSTPRENGSNSDCSQGCEGVDEVCVGAEVGGRGVCVLSTTRYVPAYSTRLKFESGYWSVVPASHGDEMGEVDPVWTESYWNTIGLRVYTVQSRAYDLNVLLAGIGVTFASYVAIVFTRATLMKVLKHD
ncbi:hypothetical protein AMTRI_Chr04g181800 [Amborella trichopoda]